VPLLKKNRIWYKSQLLLANQRFTKEDIENQIEQRILEQVESEPILASVTLLLTANYNQADKLNKCKELLNKMADNILNNPNDDKYKRIRVENKLFNENVLSLKYSQFVLTNVGFKARKLALKDDEPDIKEDFFVFDNDVNIKNLEELKSALVLSEPVLPELDRDIKIFKVRFFIYLSII
jgi:UBX domain-containing protein 6